MDSKQHPAKDRKGLFVARLPYLGHEDLRPEDKDLLSRPINLFRVLAHAPEGLRHFSRAGHWIRHESTLDPRLRELAILQVGYLTGAAYEWAHHIEIGRAFGVSDEDVRVVMEETAAEPSGLDEVERAVLRLAREMTVDLRASEESFDLVKSALGAQHLVELIIVIGFYNAVVRLLATLDVELEPEYAAALEKFPLRSAPLPGWEGRSSQRHQRWYSL